MTTNAKNLVSDEMIHAAVAWTNPMTNPLEQIRELAKNICNHYIVGSHASFKATEILAILDAVAHPVSVPEGWKLVPKHATQNMLNAFGIKEICWAESEGKTGRRPATARDIWEAMLSAAPKREGE